MKKIAWLLVLPYFVVVSSKSVPSNQDSFMKVPREQADLKRHDSTDNFSIISFSCDPSFKCVEYIKDMAESLNQAHCKRDPRPSDCPMYKVTD